MTSTTFKLKRTQCHTQLFGTISERKGKWHIQWITVATVVILMFAIGGAKATEPASTIAIDQSVISKLLSHRMNSKIETHIDLTKPFDTKSQWTLVVAKQPDEESTVQDGAENPKGPIFFCFVLNAEPDCSEAMFLSKLQQQSIITLDLGQWPFYELFTSEVVHSGIGKTHPLLMIKTCTISGADGNCGISTFLFAYDRENDKFNVVFFNITGRNNNQETRFIESGSLLGDVIVACPTSNAPFGYYIEVYKQNATSKYVRVLRYRGRTGYNDGNHLPAIDSQMPETLRRLRLWKAGDVLPMPSTMPTGCTHLVMRKGVEWCVPNSSAEPMPKYNAIYNLQTDVEHPVVGDSNLVKMIKH